jgi:hypothetical protein
MEILSDFSIFWLLPLGVIAFGIAFWLYSKNQWIQSLSAKQKWGMLTLRSVAIFLLLVLILGITIKNKSLVEEPPVIITIYDNSSSMLNYSDSSKLKSRISEFRSALEDESEGEFEFFNIRTGQEVSYEDNLDFKDGYTDLSGAFLRIKEDFYNRNIGGIILVSDGNYNKGAHPVYAAENISLTPTFSLYVGDTIKKRDQFVKNISSNQVAFLNNKFPVQIDVEAYRFGGVSTELSVFKNGKKITTEKINYKKGSQDFKQVDLMLDADEVGTHIYTVRLTNESNEFNYKNNSKTFYIEVIDSRSKVLLLASAPHPDVSAIKQELEKNENLEISSELISEWKGELNKVDLLVLHDAQDLSAEQLNKIERSGISKLVIIGSKISNADLKSLGIKITLPAGKKRDENQAYLNDGFSSFEISEDLKEEFNYFPPLNSPFGTIKTGQGNVFLYQRTGTIRKKDPLVVFGEENKAKYGVVLGEGIWRWRVNDYARHQNHERFNELISKWTQYLMVKRDNSPLKISLPERFSETEEITLNATYLNDALDPIKNARLSFVLTKEDGTSSNHVFASLGTGYKLELGKLKRGKYNWLCTSEFNGKKHSRKGSFIVEENSIEQIYSNSDIQVLRQLALRTNGSVHSLANYKDLIKAINQRGDIATLSQEKITFNGLIDLKWIFFLFFISIGLEWFLRRYLGAY